MGQKSNVLTPNVWHNLALVSDGTRLKTYTDGQLNPDELFMPAQMELIFGWIGRWLGTDGLINGYLKNIKIWNTAKTVFPTVVV